MKAERYSALDSIEEAYNIQITHEEGDFYRYYFTKEAASVLKRATVKC